MKKKILLLTVVLIISLLLGACDMLMSSGGDDLESTRVALAIQQTSLAMQQGSGGEAQPPPATQAPQVQPTYTPYPTFTSQVEQPPPAQEEPPTEEPPAEEPPAPSQSFEDWLEDVDILVYDEMVGSGEPLVISNALDAMRLGDNTKNVGDAVGNLLSEMNSAVDWDLIIIAAEDHDTVTGEIFDVVGDSLDRGSSMILEVWYIDQIFNGRIQPVMQRCGVTFHKDWRRDNRSNLNEYLIYLLQPGDPMFSQPNIISMLIPYAVYWEGDVGDTLEINTGSDAVLLAGRQQKEKNSYGLIAECIDGRLIWQTFCSHDYKTQDMINLWQNYIYNALQARYEYLQ